MKYRVQSDAVEPPFYWIEKLVDGEWQRVFGTTESTPDEAWARVTPEERKYLLERRKDFLSGAREVVWDESLRQAKAAFVHENHGGCLPREDDNFFTTGSDLV